MSHPSEPDRAIYNAAEGLIHFSLASRPTSVECAISKAALAALEDDTLAGADAMVVTYRRLRGFIHEIAERKHRARQFELGGRVVVRLEDIVALLPQPKSPAEAVAWSGRTIMDRLDL
jgi:hypothetical protein